MRFNKAWHCFISRMMAWHFPYLHHSHAQRGDHKYPELDSHSL
jgi:hypothetical protein